jgi:hypothetical protein
MSEVADILSRMQNVCDYIITSTTQVEAGEMVNLSGLDDDVAALCERAIALPPDQATQIQPLMADMISQLERLGTALRDYQDRLRSGKKEG